MIEILINSKTFIKNNLKFKFRMEESFEEIPKVSKTK